MDTLSWTHIFETTFKVTFRTLAQMAPEVPEERRVSISVRVAMEAAQTITSLQPQSGPGMTPMPEQRTPEALMTILRRRVRGRGRRMARE